MVPIYLIHPIAVHFPIVLLILVLVLDAIIVARGGDLTARLTLPNTAFWLTWAGFLSAFIAATFGHFAADRAMEVGFSGDHIEEHAGFAGITVIIFFAATVALTLLRWRKVPMAAARGWFFTAVVLVGVVFLGFTAYHGGHLVYEMGVNVEGVTPGAHVHHD